MSKKNWGQSNINFQYKKTTSESANITSSVRDETSTDKDYEKSMIKEDLVYPRIAEVRKILKSEPKLLSDEQVANFIKFGYLAINCDLPNDFNSFIYKRTESLKLSRNTNDGNNILPLMPFIQDVYDSPNVKGALISLLGNDYIMHPHRHCHITAPGLGNQNWHKDSYFGFNKPRSHLPRWVMAMYYPQDVKIEMGPTAVASNTQYLHMPKTNERHLKQIPKDWNSKELYMECKAGTVVIIHYDIWHKATLNKSNINRYMFKFQFVRLSEPILPSWNHLGKENPFVNVNDPQAPVWAYIWEWMNGGGDQVDKYNSNNKETESIKNLSKMIEDYKVETEPIRLWGAYKLAKYGSAGVNALLKTLQDENEVDSVRRSSCYGLIAASSLSVKPLIDLYANSSPKLQSLILFALGEIGTKAASSIELIMSQINSKNMYIKLNAVEALGNICNGVSNEETLSNVSLGLVQSLSDNDEQTRFRACLSMIQIANKVSSPIVLEALETALDDSNRYVRGYAVLALERMATKESLAILVKELMKSRWDPLTTKNTQF